MKLSLSVSNKEDTEVEWHLLLSYAVVYGDFDVMFKKLTSDTSFTSCGWRNVCASHFAAAVGNLTMIKMMHNLQLGVWGNSFVGDLKHLTPPPC